MKHALLSIVFCFFTSIHAQAGSLIAIVDSGTDFAHELLKGKEWTNAAEKKQNLIDDDHNGKVDDLHGWNFADGSSTLFVRDHLESINPIVFPLFRIIANMQAGKISEEDKDFWEKNVKTLPPDQRQNLVNHLNFYGQYAHGTHVAGISAALAPKSKLLIGRMFPDEPVQDYEHRGPQSLQPFGVIDVLYGLLARFTNLTFDSAALYLDQNKADVANYSLGVGLKMIAEQLLIVRGTKEPTPEQISKETHRLFKKYQPRGEAWIKSSPGTLFVIAAGNDGSDNDAYPIFPGSVRASNSITVAATQGVDSLANFSNYGATSVDVAAPGVSIWSTVPSLDAKAMLPMSGTSMAAPFVTGVAGQMKTVNPGLSPEGMKQILMGTVDLKAWLKGKVISSGIVNAKRAIHAARLAHMKTVQDAITQSLTDVADVQEDPPTPMSPQLIDAPQELLDLAKILVF